jgi:hypothetical protein
VTESILEIGEFDPDSEGETDSQIKLLETSRNLVEEQFLRIRYDCDLLIPKPKSTPRCRGGGGGGGGDVIIWYCSHCSNGPNSM